MTWAALLLQLYLSLEVREVSVPVLLGRYFSYFTILTNIMAAISYTAVALQPPSGMLQKLARPSSLTAVTLYIVMVGIIYNTVLRSLYELHGLALVADRTLHSVVPVSFLLFWILFVPKSTLRFMQAIGWLWYPVAYVIYVIVIGALTGFYPYPFANADKLGYSRALMNGAWVVVAFLVMALLLIGAGRMFRRGSVLSED